MRCADGPTASGSAGARDGVSADRRSARLRRRRGQPPMTRVESSLDRGGEQRRALGARLLGREVGLRRERSRRATVPARRCTSPRSRRRASSASRTASGSVTDAAPARASQPSTGVGQELLQHRRASRAVTGPSELGTRASSGGAARSPCDAEEASCISSRGSRPALEPAGRPSGGCGRRRPPTSCSARPSSADACRARSSPAHPLECTSPRVAPRGRAQPRHRPRGRAAAS